MSEKCIKRKVKFTNSAGRFLDTYVDQFYPSTHICSVEHKKIDRKLSLAEESWDCPHCFEEHDRDINAVRNILYEARRTLADMGGHPGSLVMSDHRHTW